MSFLTPFYILGLAAISLPVLFHLIRRAPKGVQPFSSLMFIAATPPRLTRRSRLDQLLLLLLRAAILGLLAFAFARPFLRSAATTDLADVSTRVVAVLIDTSGSMQRQGIWQQVTAEMGRVLEDLGPQDAIALYHFGARAERLTSFDEAKQLEQGGRRELLRSSFDQLRPDWGASALGDAMILAADDLDAVEDSSTSATIRQLIVISDLQRGSQIESLQGYQWPRSVNVVFRRVEPALPGNATLQVLGSLASEEDERGVRVRVANSEDAEQQQFEISWADAAQTPLGTSLGVSVPPGAARVVHLPRLPPDATPTHLQLTGDAHDFDNSFFIATTEPTAGSIVYLGQETDDDPEQMLYYLQRAVTNDQWQQVNVITEKQAALGALASEQPLLVVITGPLEPTAEVAVQQYLNKGGTGLLILSRPDDAAVAASVGAPSLATGEEVTPNDYALWSEVDFTHRLFRPFANPLYNDFSKIYFWKYRRLAIADESAWKTIVRYDSGDAALLQATVADGSLYVLTASWRPEESQLARSSKFVPLLTRMVSTDVPLQGVGYEVNEDITCTRPTNDTKITIIKPDGTVVPLPSDQTAFSGTDQPGLYQVQTGDASQVVAVNLSRLETRTAPLDVAQLEQRGVRLGDGSTRAEELEASRQKRDIELEATQSVWQWLIAAALLLVIVETVVASRGSMRAAPNQDVSPTSVAPVAEP